MKETLRQKQSRFAQAAAKLIQRAGEIGFEVTLGEAYRSPEEAARLAALGKGIVDSLHTQRLAIDLNLFRGGHLITNGEQHRPLGEWWEGQYPDARWGGRFGDGNHYSFEHEGKK